MIGTYIGFFCSFAVEAAFYGDVDTVIGFFHFVKLFLPPF